MKIGNRILMKTPKANKEHECSLCRQTILKGVHYTRATAQAGGTFISKRYCNVHSWKEVQADMREARNALKVSSFLARATTT
jgi:hypothetical protein